MAKKSNIKETIVDLLPFILIVGPFVAYSIWYQRKSEPYLDAVKECMRIWKEAHADQRIVSPAHNLARQMESEQEFVKVCAQERLYEGARNPVIME